MTETIEVVHSQEKVKETGPSGEGSSGSSSSCKKFFDLKGILIVVLGCLLVVSVVLCIYLPLHYKSEKDKDKYHDYDFEYWTKDAKPIKKLKEYIKDITNKDSKNYIPLEERVATFDMDGTIIGEKAPTYLEWVFYQAFVIDHPDLADHSGHMDIVNRINEYIKTEDDAALDKDQLVWHAKAFKDWTLDQTGKYIDEFVEKDVPGFNGLKYKNLFFKPMVEIINFLQENSFKVVIVTGSERFWVRHYVNKYLPTKVQIPRNQFIGADVEIIATGEKEESYYDSSTLMKNDGHIYSHTDSTLRSGVYIDENMYMGKVRRIIREIGIQPVLAFGNSGGDVAMMNYVTTGNPYKSLAFMLVADDTKREYGLTEEGAKSKKEKWTSSEHGYEIVSMRDDWTTIYGDDVTLKK